MEIIPVVDLMGGQVVHARRGDRASYRPIETPLAPGAEPLDIAAALLDLAPFRRLYVADLDAIAGRAGHDETVEAIARAHPDVEIWVDRGEVRPADLRRRATAGPGVSVIGTESFATFADFAAAMAVSNGVLSLDHDAGGPIGPPEIHADPDGWPDRVIVMTLARVGAGNGPDIERLREVKRLGGGRAVFAAGGVRGADDLRELTRHGVAGALVASAVHDGRLNRDDLARALEGWPRTAPRR